MLPRHPLLWNLCTVLAICLLVGISFYGQNAIVIITRDYYLMQTNDKKSNDNITKNFSKSLSDVYFIGEETATTAATTSNITTTNTTTATTTIAIPSTTEYVRRVDGQSIIFTIDQATCGKEHYLLIYIHSGPENAERRRVIRNTWGNTDILKMQNAKLVFLTGHVNNANLQVTLEYENELHHDIVQGNFTDTYRNLTYKAVTALKWTYKNCPNVVYVLKTDDDMIVDIHRVVRLMHSDMEKNWGKKDILAGFIWPHMDVDRNIKSKWYTSPAEFSSNFYPKYCSGSAYIMSSDVVEKFYLKSLDTPFFWVDDYYVTGMLAHASNISPKSLNDRYILENNADIRGQLKNDKTDRLLFIHSPNTNTSMHVWQSYLDRY